MCFVSLAVEIEGLSPKTKRWTGKVIVCRWWHCSIERESERDSKSFSGGVVRCGLPPRVLLLPFSIHSLIPRLLYLPLVSLSVFMADRDDGWLQISDTHTLYCYALQGTLPALLIRSNLHQCMQPMPSCVSLCKSQKKPLSCAWLTLCFHNGAMPIMKT